MEGTLALSLSNTEWRTHKHLVSHFLARRTDATLTLSHLTHTHSYSHLSACSPSHTNSGGLILSNLPSTAHTHKEGTPPSHSHSHTQIEGHTPLTLTSHTHRVEGVDSSTTTLALTFKHTMEDSFSLRLTHAQSLTQRGGHTPSSSHSNTE